MSTEPGIPVGPQVPGPFCSLVEVGPGDGVQTPPGSYIGLGIVDLVCPAPGAWVPAAIMLE
eukprot:13187421-Alexandrium_andersonii.AAC.1